MALAGGNVLRTRQQQLCFPPVVPRNSGPSGLADWRIRRPFRRRDRLCTVLRRVPLHLGSAPTMGASSRARAAMRLHSLPLRSKLFMEDDVIQLCRHLFQRHFLVLLPEEHGVDRRARITRSLPWSDGFAFISGDHVGDQQEFIGQLAGFWVTQRKAFLVLFHAGDEHFWRHVEEACIKVNPSARLAIH